MANIKNPFKGSTVRNPYTGSTGSKSSKGGKSTKGKGATVTVGRAPVTAGGGIKQWQNYKWPEPSQDYTALAQSELVQPDNAAISSPFGPSGGNNGGGGRGGRGGGGGGAPAGPTPEQVRQWAAELYGFNAAPYDQQRADIAAQKAQATGYNPDFAGMQAQYEQRLASTDAERQAQVQARLQNVVDVGQRLAGQSGQAISGAVRDLTAQGINPNAYMQQANQIGGERTANLANQAGYMGQLNAAGAQNLADFRNTGNLTRLGGEATLANNRGSLLNLLQEKLSQIGVQQAQAQQANDQARREFLIKYGVT